VIRQLERSVDELIPEQFLDVNDYFTPYFPSTSANYVQSRSDLGSVGWLLEQPYYKKFMKREEGYLSTLTETSRDVKEEESRTPVRKRDYQWDTEQKGNMLFDFIGLVNATENAASEEPNRVDFVGLSEALKVRVITKEPPARTFFLKIFQKKLWKILKQYRVFKLISSPTSPEIIQDGLGKKLPKGYSFLNGDYSAATNKIKSFVSETIARRICLRFGLSDVETELFVDSLVNHRFSLDGRQVEQHRGQFMGSITSFVVLCIANFALSRWALEIAEERTISVKNVAMLINGDDVVIKGPDSLFPIWKEVTEAGGLETSVGKTFVSKKFANINSRNYRYTPEDGYLVERIDRRPNFRGRVVNQTIVYRQTPIVLMGVLLGKDRSGGPDSGAMGKREILEFRYKDLMSNCPEFCREQVHKMFIRKHESVLKQSNIPWYMPSWIGGYGLVGYKEPSELDRRIGRRILLDWRNHQPQTVRNKTEWQTWNLAEKFVKDRVETDSSEFDEEGAEAYQELVASKALDILFHADTSSKTIKKKMVKARGMNTIYHHNEKLWRLKGAKKVGKLPKPLTIDELRTRRSYLTTSIVDHNEERSMRRRLTQEQRNAQQASISDLD
jgi:hypothetical protein